MKIEEKKKHHKLHLLLDKFEKFAKKFPSGEKVPNLDNYPWSLEWNV